MKELKNIIFFLLMLTNIGHAQEKLCFGSDAPAVINASLLLDGSYEILYSLSGANNVTNLKVTVAFVNGLGSVNFSNVDFTKSGITSVTVTGMKNLQTECETVFPSALKKEFIIQDYKNLNLQSDYTFCKDKKKRLSDITDLTQWFNQDKEPIGSNELLQSGVYYYKNITDDGCLGLTFIPVQVTIQSCELLVPNAFSPNNDNMNDNYNILNIIDKYPNYEMTIVNRHGKIVYKGKNGWNGTVNNQGGELLENGLYYMYLDYNDVSKVNTKHTILLQN